MHRNFVILGLALAFVGLVVLVIGMTNEICPICPLGATCGCYLYVNYPGLYAGITILGAGAAISLASVFIRTKPTSPSPGVGKLAKS